MKNEPVAIRYDFDGYGYQYRDSGHGSNWRARLPEGELLYTHPASEGIREQQRTIDGDKRLIDLLYEKVEKQQAEIAELKHINRNWQISEGMALAEIEALKADNGHYRDMAVDFLKRR